MPVTEFFHLEANVHDAVALGVLDASRIWEPSFVNRGLWLPP
jgi:hypothetical protein